MWAFGPPFLGGVQGFEAVQCGGVRLTYKPKVHSTSMIDMLERFQHPSLARLSGRGHTAYLQHVPLPAQTSVAVDRVALYVLLGLLQIRPTQSARDETRDLQPDGSLEFYFVAGVAVLCLLAVWEWLKRVWDQLDAWWAGSQASSRRARRLRRMQRAIEDELAAQLQGMRLDDVPAAASAADSGVLSTRPPRGDSVPSQSSKPTRPSQPAESSRLSRPATLARSPTSPQTPGA